MQVKTNKSNIIALALVYAYISDGRTELKEYDVDRFFLNLCIAMSNNPLAPKISDEEEAGQEVYYQDKNYNYVLKTPEELANVCRQYIDNIPEKIFFESLKEENLSQINVDSSKINLTSETEHRHETVAVSSMNANSAISSAKSILENRGCNNIEINSVQYSDMRNDHIWNVHASYDKDKYYLDLAKKVKSYVKKYNS